MTYPMRINKYLAEQGYATRRGADELIEKGKVFINGKPAELGSKVHEDDTVEVKTGKRKTGDYLYFAYNKPRGVITHSPGEDEQDVRTRFPSLQIRECSQWDALIRTRTASSSLRMTGA